MATGSAIGMMDGAFFVSKSAILDWLNSTYKLHLSKIEETASGALSDAWHGRSLAADPCFDLAAPRLTRSFVLQALLPARFWTPSFRAK